MLDLATRRVWLGRVRAALVAIVAATLFTSAVELMAYLFLHDGNERLNPHFAAELNDWIKDPATVPALCRWDAVWYMDIATGSYPGKGGLSAHNAAFFPLYPLAMRGFMKVFGLSAAYAGAWVTRACLPGTIALLREFVRLNGGNVAAGWAAVAALLFAPNGFVLIAGMADGFFLFLSLLTVVLALRDRPYLAMVAGFLAGLSRVHAFALLVALVVMGVVRARDTRGLARAKGFAASVGCGLGLGALMLYFQSVAHDPLLFIHEQAYFGKATFDPKAPLSSLAELPYYWSVWPPSNMADFLNGMRLPGAVAVVASCAYFLVKRRWFELAYSAALYAMIVLSTHWGIVRYMVMIFPIPVALSALHRWRPLWLGFLLVNCMIEAYLLLQWVMLRPGV